MMNKAGLDKSEAARFQSESAEAAALLLVPAETLSEACRHAFVHAGLSERDATTATAALVDANLRGVDTHGVVRLEKYIRGLQKRAINPVPKIEVTRSAPAVLRVDGDNGLGSIVASKTMEELIRLCKQTGVAAAGVKRSNHYGTISFYLLKAAEQGLIAIGAVHGESLQVPFGGTTPYFGTNPLGFAFPGRDQPIVIDFATSATTFGRIVQARKLKQSLSEGQAIDSAGNSVTDPEQAARILPMAGHKGYGLALAVEVLSAVLNDCPVGPHVPAVFRDDIDAPGQLGHFFMAIDPSCFAGADQFFESISQMSRELHACCPAPGFPAVLVPGEPEADIYDRRIREGVPLSHELWKNIQRLTSSGLPGLERNPRM